MKIQIEAKINEYDCNDCFYSSVDEDGIYGCMLFVTELKCDEEYEKAVACTDCLIARKAV